MATPRLLRITTVPISLRLLLHGQLKFMQVQGFELLAVSADGPEVNEITKQGIPHAVVSFTRKITPIRDLYCLLQLITIILKFKPDIVHAHTPKAGLLGMIAAWICRVPIRMHTVAGLPMTEARGLKKSILKMSEKLTYHCATSVYPNSKGLHDYILKKFKVPNSKFKTIGKGSSNGIDLDYFKKTDALIKLSAGVRMRYGIDKDDFVYCFAGRVVKDKGITELINAFIKIDKEKRGVWLFLVGHFEDELDPLQQDIKLAITSHPRIIHPGFQQDIRPWIIACDVFVLPSYREGFPNVVLQAGSLEKPSIASDINGCNEIIRDSQTGILVPAKDTEALQRAMMSLLSNRDDGVKMGIASRKFIGAHFDQSYIWQELLMEYQKHLANCI